MALLQSVEMEVLELQIALLGHLLLMQRVAEEAQKPELPEQVGRVSVETGRLEQEPQQRLEAPTRDRAEVVLGITQTEEMAAPV
jgi:hypothetical protein